MLKQIAKIFGLRFAHTACSKGNRRNHLQFKKTDISATEVTGWIKFTYTFSFCCPMSDKYESYWYLFQYDFFGTPGFALEVQLPKTLRCGNKVETTIWVNPEAEKVFLAKYPNDDIVVKDVELGSLGVKYCFEATSGSMCCNQAVGHIHRKKV